MSLKTQTAESVAQGHPDKVCDQLADAILDAYLARDRNAKVAIECLISQNLVVIAGEVQSTVTVAVEPLVRQQLAAIGYQDAASGIDPQRCTIPTYTNNLLIFSVEWLSKAPGIKVRFMVTPRLNHRRYCPLH